jgi:hypothetical protein
VTKSIAEFDEQPEPHPRDSRGMSHPNASHVTPQAKEDKRNVNDYKTHSKVLAHEATYVARRWKHMVEPEDVLFDRMRCLREDECEKGELAASIHLRSGCFLQTALRSDNPSLPHNKNGNLTDKIRILRKKM